MKVSFLRRRKGGEYEMVKRRQLIAALRVWIVGLAVLGGRFAHGVNITLEWDRQSSANIAAYRIYYGKKSGKYSNFIQVPGFSSRAVVTGLAADTKYFFSATAIDVQGFESDFSGEVTQITVSNAAPVARNLIFSTREDTPTQIVLAGSASSGGAMVYGLVSSPAKGTLTGTPPTLQYMPNTNFFGTDKFCYFVSDGRESATGKVTINITSENDPPTLDALTGIVLAQNAGPQRVSLTGITSGPFELPQRLTVTAASSNPYLIPAPSIEYISPNSTGTLIFTPNTNRTGWSTLTVKVMDDGASNNITCRSFWVLVNNPPTLDPLPNILMMQDSPPQVVQLTGISSGGVNETQVMWVGAWSNNRGVAPTPTVSYTSPNSNGTLTIAPPPKAYGVATITVTAKDDQYANNTVSRSFTVTVKPLHDPPTLSGIASMTMDSSFGAKTISLFGISAGVANDASMLTISAQSSNPSLVPNPIITYTAPGATALLTIDPAFRQVGTAVITVTADNHQPVDNVVRRSFVVTVVSPPQIGNFSATMFDARTMQVAWTTDRAATCALDYGVAPNVDQTVEEAEGTVHSVTLTDLQPDKSYLVRVRAATANGRATNEFAVQTVTRTVSWEAEEGTHDGALQVADDSVFNGLYVENASATSTVDWFEISLDRGLFYNLWARIKAPTDGIPMNVWIGATDQIAAIVESPDSRGGWRWVKVADAQNRDSAVSFAFEQGLQRLGIEIAPGIAVDRITLINDPLWVPILPSTRPKLSLGRDMEGRPVIMWKDPSRNADAMRFEYSLDGVNYLFWIDAAMDGEVALSVGGMRYFFRAFSYNAVEHSEYSEVLIVEP